MDLTSHKLIYADEFDTLNLTSAKKTGWNTVYHWGDRFLNAEQQVYVDPSYKNYGINPFSVDDGILTITAQKAPKGFETPANFRHPADQAYTSGLLNSEHAFSVQYGYFEIRAEMPAGQGLWPAFWLLQSNGQWPAEYDVVEVLGHDTDTLHATSHSRDANGRHVQEHAASTLFDSAKGFHTYGFDWTADKITWYYDGVKVFEADNHVTDQSMYMLINLAVGGDWPGAPNAKTAFPAEMKVDYVRVYQAAVDHPVVGMPSDWKAMSVANFSTLNESALNASNGATVRQTWDYETTLDARYTSLKMMGDWANFATGNARDNYIEGGSGPYNEIDGRGGNDVYKGGAGMDVFVVRDGQGNDRILDFSNLPGNTDKLKLVGFHFTHFDDLAPYLSQTKDGVLLRLDADQAVFFDRVAISDLKAEQFVFVDSVAAPAGAKPVTAPSPTPSPPPVVPTPGDGFNQRIEGKATDYNRLSGGADRDWILGGDAGNDLNGRGGNDRLEGGKGNDFLTGGPGDDVFVFAKGDVSRSGALDRILDFGGAGARGGDVILFQGLGDDGSLRFGGYQKLYDSSGQMVGYDETRQYYRVYDGDKYEGIVLVKSASGALLGADDYAFG